MCRPLGRGGRNLLVSSFRSVGRNVLIGQGGRVLGVGPWRTYIYVRKRIYNFLLGIFGWWMFRSYTKVIYVSSPVLPILESNQVGDRSSKVGNYRLYPRGTRMEITGPYGLANTKLSDDCVCHAAPFVVPAAPTHEHQYVR